MSDASRPSLFETLHEAEHLQVIAEMKRASPSKGLIAEGADPVAQAITYYKAGAACISVLTDATFFKGSFDDLAAVAKAVPIPLLMQRLYDSSKYKLTEQNVPGHRSSYSLSLHLMTRNLLNSMPMRLHLDLKCLWKCMMEKNLNVRLH